MEVRLFVSTKIALVDKSNANTLPQLTITIHAHKPNVPVSNMNLNAFTSPTQLEYSEPIESNDTNEDVNEEVSPEPVVNNEQKKPPTPPPKPTTRPLPSLPLPSQPNDSAAASTTPCKWYRVIGSYAVGSLRFVREEFARLGFRETKQDDVEVDAYWSRAFYNFLPTLKPHQKVNFIPAMPEICRKDLLNRNIKKLASRVGYKYFDFWPVSFNLPMEYDEFVQEYNRDPSPYILKPPLAARGEGIRMAATLDDVDVNSEFVQKKIPVAQKYITNPLLFYGHKMTFRLYVVVTSLDPLRIYVYNNGLVRICSQKYSTESYSNLLAHLTNWDLNKDFESQFNEKLENTEVKHDGLRSDLKYIFEGLEEAGADIQRLWNEIRQLIAKSVLAAEPIIQHWVHKKVPQRNNVYELLGYDILIDEDLKPWLLEVNHTPSLSPHTGLENEIKASMIRELLQLVDVEQKWTNHVIERTDQIFKLIQEKLAGQRCGWSTSYISLDQLSRMDVWTIVDTEVEFERRGNWIRVFPEKDSVELIPLLSVQNRNRLLIQWIASGASWDKIL